MIYISSDHAGFDVKGTIVVLLKTQNREVNDLGPYVFNKDDDYPDFAFTLGEKVAEENGRGILVCGSGVGICIAANKVVGVRAALIESKEQAIKAREDDDANVLVLDRITYDPTKDFEIIEAWIKTKFTYAERHIRRINKITEYEKR